MWTVFHVFLNQVYVSTPSEERLKEDAFRSWLVLSRRVVMMQSIRFDLLCEVDGEQVTHAAMRFIWYCSIAHVAMRFR